MDIGWRRSLFLLARVTGGDHDHQRFEHVLQRGFRLDRPTGRHVSGYRLIGRHRASARQALIAFVAYPTPRGPGITPSMRSTIWSVIVVSFLCDVVAEVFDVFLRAGGEQAFDCLGHARIRDRDGMIRGHVVEVETASEKRVVGQVDDR